MFETIEKRTRTGGIARNTITVSHIRQKKSRDQIEVSVPFFIANPRHLGGFVKVQYDRDTRVMRLSASDDSVGYKANSRGKGHMKYGVKFTPGDDLLKSIFPNGNRRHDVLEYVDVSKDCIEFKLP